MTYLPDWSAALPRLLEETSIENKSSYIRGYQTGINSDNPSSANSQAVFLSANMLCELLINWHENADVKKVKELAFLSSKLRRMCYQYRSDAGLAYGNFRMFTALLSDEPNINHWFAWHVIPCLAKSKGRKPSYLQPGSQEFHAFNCHLALLGEFDWLAERMDQVLVEGIKLRDGKSYRFDNLFLKALVEGDKQAMEDNIHAVLTGRVAYPRNNENGMAYQSKVVSTWGVILSKIAYRNGFELDIDSPWVPKEWLPIQPLDEYECPSELDFVKEFDMFTSFKKGSPYIKNAMDFSPIHPSQEQPNLREWVERVDWEYP
ncbi:MAG: immunity 49 family protein [Bermanella sp.]